MMRVLVASLVLLSLIALAPSGEAKPVPPGPCAEQDLAPAPAHVYITMGCVTYVDLGETECLWGGYWTTVANTGSQVVRVWRCGEP